MPIQIRELHIKVVVNAAESPPSSTAPPGGGSQQQAADKADTDKDLIIAECIEQVMTIMRDKLEK